ncbi:trypsin-like peptidase domain-containing protein [Pseudorhodoferax sp.]|uniref:trypsin-like peptidase domain-containing protein n=1 Tax=Pseudorhodoferax sp. TaxID=1993553 RepID=UPI002DD6A6C2|nr:trypsin-like peptidase domain-containing protein [Pseudorhodoferax sp.]
MPASHRLIPCLFALLLCGLAAAPARADIDAKAMVGSTVRVFCKTGDGIGTGSGFVVGKQSRHVLTNAHVVSGCSDILVLSPRDSGDPLQIKGQVVWNSRSSVSRQHLDAALLELADTTGGRGVAFARKTTVAMGDPVVAVGYPSAADGVAAIEAVARPTVTQGHISRTLIRRPDGDQRTSAGVVGLYQITASIGPGSSGGPLFNVYGEVIGINTEKSLIRTAVISDAGQVGTERVPLMDGVAWSQEIDELLPMLQEHGIEYRQTLERRNWFWAWLHREPVTAGAFGAVGVLLLATLGLLLMRRPLPFGRGARSGGAGKGSGQGAAAAYVEGVAGPYAGARFTVQGDLVFGRDAEACNVVFDAAQDGISARHCALRFDARKGFELRDLGSTNGTFVDGQRLDPHRPRPLRDKQEFQLFGRGCRFAVHAPPTR